MRAFLSDYKVAKVLLDSAHDAMPYYLYFKREKITPFIDLNGKGGIPPVYKNDFTIDTDGVPICPSGFRMRRDGIEVAFQHIWKGLSDSFPSNPFPSYLVIL